MQSLTSLVASATLLLTVGVAGAQEGPADEAIIAFSENAGVHPVWGFGGEWDPHFWRTQNTRRGCNETAWRRVTEKIRDLGVDRVRMMILPDWYEPDNDNDDPANTDDAAFTWDSEAMTSLYRHLDVCQEAGIRVTLTWWCAPVRRQTDSAPYWLAFPDVKQWCSAPNNAAECVENVVAGLQHLIDKRGYSCIDAFTFVNEPDWTFFNNENKVEFEPYADICRALHARLEAVGLRQRLVLDLADASVHNGWLKQSVEALQGVADRYNSHSYIFSCEDENYAQAMRNWAGERVRTCGKSPFSTNELGTRHYKGAYSVTDLESFERAFCVAQYALLGMNEGMTGALYWGLYDQYYYDGNDPDDGSNGGKMTTGLMAYIDEDWRLRPTGQAWSLVCHAAPRGSRIHAGRSTHADVDAVALALPDDGGASILLVNRAKTPCTVQFEALPPAAEALDITQASVFGRDGLSQLGVAPDHPLVIPAESLAWLSFGKRN